MNFWDNFAKRVTEAADYTVKEAEKLTGAAKLKFDMAVLQKRIDDIYTNIGTLRYEEYKTSADRAEEIKTACEEIDMLKDKLNALELEHAALRNYKLCPACGIKIDRDAAFCPKCGANQTPKTEEAPEAGEAPKAEDSAEAAEAPKAEDVPETEEAPKADEAPETEEAKKDEAGPDAQ